LPLSLEKSWGNAANTTITGGLLTIGGSATDDGAFFDWNPLTESWGNYSAVQITARRDAGNVAANFYLYAEIDGMSTPYALPISTSLFGTTLSTVTVDLLPTISPTDVISIWGITTTASGTDAFRMTFDSIALTSIPEPSTYAAIFGALTLGGVCYRRYRRK